MANQEYPAVLKQSIGTQNVWGTVRRDQRPDFFRAELGVICTGDMDN
jgi:hypothetical protein